MVDVEGGEGVTERRSKYNVDDGVDKTRDCATCRFRLMLSRGYFEGFFHCAAISDDWMHLWSNDPDDLTFRFGDCENHITGEPLMIDHELTQAEFYQVAGERIRMRDWNEWGRRGVG